MIKRILLLSIVFVVIEAILTVNMNKIEKYYIILVVTVGILFSLLLLREIYNHHRANSPEYNDQVSNISSSDDVLDISKLNKISENLFLFGLESRVVSDYDFYFDDDNFYAINTKKRLQAVFKLTDITELSKTSVKINYRWIWQVKIRQGDADEIVFRFAHNRTLWNNNFYRFYERVKSINPSVVKTEWNIWTR